MPSVAMIGRLWTMVAASCFLFTMANAQDAFDIMSGRILTTSAPSTIFSFGENPNVDFPPRTRVIIRPKVHAESSSAYCVRTCDGRYFPDPQRFLPQRWTGDLNLPKLAYFPFGAGPRICIGSSFAMMEAVLGLATIIQKFRLTAAPDYHVEAWPAITLDD